MSAGTVGGWRRSGSVVGVAVAVAVAIAPPRGAAAAAPSGGKGAVTFELNEGQFEAGVKVVSRHRGMLTYLRGDDLVTTVSEREPGRRADVPEPKSHRPGTRSAVHMRFHGALTGAQVTGIDPIPGKTHYLIGNDRSRWRRGVTNYRKVKVTGLYPGVDLVLHGESGQLEYDLVVGAGADPSVIDLGFTAASDPSADASGDMVLRTARGAVRHVRPRAYEEHGGRRNPVATRFVRKTSGRWGFDVTRRDRSRRVTIDPEIVYSNVSGGGLDEYFAGVAVDSVGNSYVTGWTPSPDFPSTSGGLVGPANVIVQKRNPRGDLVYSAIIGGSGAGSGGDYAYSIAVDRAARPYVVGTTSSNDFPVRTNFQPTMMTAEGQTIGHDAFIFRLNRAGDDFEYSTFFGGDGSDVFHHVVVSPEGSAYVAGRTTSRNKLQGGYPLIGEIQQAYPEFASSVIAFAQFLPNGNPIFSTYFGGRPFESANPFVRDIAIDAGGALYAIGYGIVPMRKAAWTKDSNFQQPFLAKIENATLKFSTYIPAHVHGIAVDRKDNIYVSGWPLSPPASFGALPSRCPTGGASGPIYLLKMTSRGRPVSLDMASAPERGWISDLAIARDGTVSAVGGYEPPSYEDEGGQKSFLVQFDSDGCQADWTEIGSANMGSSDDAMGVAVDLWGNVYVAGGWNWDPTYPHVTTQDGFITKYEGSIDDLPPDCQGCEDPGLPVNLFTGSVWLRQTDVVLPGVVGLQFTRSYNSVGFLEPTNSAFGPGWTHPFEQNLSDKGEELRLRQATGVPMTFTSTDGSTYRASVPASETSWIVKTDAGYVRHFLQGGSEDYDVMGNLTVVRDALGNETRLTWVDGLLTGIRDPGGRELKLTYTRGRITTLLDPVEVIATYGYGPFGQLSLVSYPDGRGYQLRYDSKGNLVRMEDLAGRVVESHQYDAQGRAITSEIADGVDRLTFAYAPGVTTVTDALGRAATYQYSKFGGINQVTSRTGSCASCGGAESESWTYYADGRVHTHRIGSDAPTTFTYTSAGDVETVTDPAGRTTSYTYDENGRVLTRTAPGEGTTVWTQSAAGPLSVTVPVTATTARQTTFTYTAAGQLETARDSEGHVTTNVYDAVGDLRVVRDPLGHETSFTYDSMGRRVLVTDALGNWTQTSYDSVGRVESVNVSGSTTEFAYDKHGQRSVITDPLGRQTRYAYDRYGRLESVVDPASGTTRYRYDAASQKLSLTDAEGRTTTFAYDGQGRLTTTTYPGGRSESFTYDSAGRLRTKTDRKGVTTTYDYDAAGRLETKSYSDSSPDVTFDYDTAGRLTSAANADDTVARTYDLAGALLSETSSHNGATVVAEYDTLGRRSALKLGAGAGQTTVATYDYDAASRLRKLVSRAGDFDLGYDAANRRTSATFPNGIATSYYYDPLNRLVGLSSGVAVQVVYSYDAAGNRTSKTLPGLTENYSYDALSRLVSADRSDGTLAGFRYDKVGNRTRAQVGSSVVSAAVNARNELQSETGGGRLRVRAQLDEPGVVRVGGAPATALAGNVFEAEVDAAVGTNEFVVEASDASGNKRRSTYQVNVPASNASFTYDLNGNLTSKTAGGHVWGYEWNVENQLTRVTRDGTEVARFSYDPLGRRLTKTAGGATTSYLYDGDDILREAVSDGGPVYTYVHGPGVDEPWVRFDAAAVPTYYHADGLGSIIATTNSGGHVTSRRQYDAWGNLEQGADQPGYAFTGREWDPETGLYYYRARYYDPKVGRFISADPTGFKGGVNVYAYVGNNPLIYVDPLGLKADLILFAQGTEEYKAAMAHTNDDDAFTVAAHGIGNEWGVLDQRKSLTGNSISPYDLAVAILKNGYRPGQRIRLLVCWTARGDYLERLSEELANPIDGAVKVSGPFERLIWDTDPLRAPQQYRSEGKLTWRTAARPWNPWRRGRP